MWPFLTKYLKSPIALLVCLALVLQLLPAPQPAQAGFWDIIKKIISKIDLPDEAELNNEGQIILEPLLTKGNSPNIATYSIFDWMFDDVLKDRGWQSWDDTGASRDIPERKINPFSRMSLSGGDSSDKEHDENTGKPTIANPIIPEECELRIKRPGDPLSDLSEEESLAHRAACSYFIRLQKAAAEEVYLAKRIFNSTNPYDDCFFLANCRSKCYLSYGELKYVITWLDIAQFLLPTAWVTVVKKIMGVLAALEEIHKAYKALKSLFEDGINLVNNFMATFNYLVNMFEALKNIGGTMSASIGVGSVVVSAALEGLDAVGVLKIPDNALKYGQVAAAGATVLTAGKGISSMGDMLKRFSDNLLAYSSAKSETNNYILGISRDLTAMLEGDSAASLKGAKHEQELDFFFEPNNPTRKNLDQIVNDFQRSFKTLADLLDKTVGPGLLPGEKITELLSTSELLIEERPVSTGSGAGVSQNVPIYGTFFEDESGVFVVDNKENFCFGRVAPPYSINKTNVCLFQDDQVIPWEAICPEGSTLPTKEDELRNLTDPEVIKSILVGALGGINCDESDSYCLQRLRDGDKWKRDWVDYWLALGKNVLGESNQLVIDLGKLIKEQENEGDYPSYEIKNDAPYNPSNIQTTIVNYPGEIDYEFLRYIAWLDDEDGKGKQNKEHYYYPTEIEDYAQKGALSNTEKYLDLTYEPELLKQGLFLGVCVPERLELANWLQNFQTIFKNTSILQTTVSLLDPVELEKMLIGEDSIMACATQSGRCKLDGDVQEWREYWESLADTYIGAERVTEIKNNFYADLNEFELIDLLGDLLAEIDESARIILLQKYELDSFINLANDPRNLADELVVYYLYEADESDKNDLFAILDELDQSTVQKKHEKIVNECLKNEPSDNSLLGYIAAIEFGSNPEIDGIPYDFSDKLFDGREFDGIKDRNHGYFNDYAGNNCQSENDLKEMATQEFVSCLIAEYETGRKGGYDGIILEISEILEYVNDLSHQKSYLEEPDRHLTTVPKKERHLSKGADLYGGNDYWQSKFWCADNCSTDAASQLEKVYDPDLVRYDWDSRVRAVVDSSDDLATIADALSMPGMTPQTPVIVYEITKDSQDLSTAVQQAVSSVTYFGQKRNRDCDLYRYFYQQYIYFEENGGERDCDECKCDTRGCLDWTGALPPDDFDWCALSPAHPACLGQECACCSDAGDCESQKQSKNAAVSPKCTDTDTADGGKEKSVLSGLFSDWNYYFGSQGSDGYQKVEEIKGKFLALQDVWLDNSLDNPKTSASFAKSYAASIIESKGLAQDIDKLLSELKIFFDEEENTPANMRAQITNNLGYLPEDQKKELLDIVDNFEPYYIQVKKEVIEPLDKAIGEYTYPADASVCPADVQEKGFLNRISCFEWCGGVAFETCIQGGNLQPRLFEAFAGPLSAIENLEYSLFWLTEAEKETDDVSSIQESVNNLKPEIKSEALQLNPGLIQDLEDKVTGGIKKAFNKYNPFAKATTETGVDGIDENPSDDKINTEIFKSVPDGEIKSFGDLADALTNSPLFYLKDQFENIENTSGAIKNKLLEAEGWLSTFFNDGLDRDVQYETALNNVKDKKMTGLALLVFGNDAIKPACAALGILLRGNLEEMDRVCKQKDDDGERDDEFLVKYDTSTMKQNCEAWLNLPGEVVSKDEINANIDALEKQRDCVGTYCIKCPTWLCQGAGDPKCMSVSECPSTYNKKIYGEYKTVCRQGAAAVFDVNVFTPETRKWPPTKPPLLGGYTIGYQGAKTICIQTQAQLALLKTSSSATTSPAALEILGLTDTCSELRRQQQLKRECEKHTLTKCAAQDKCGSFAECNIVICDPPDCSGAKITCSGLREDMNEICTVNEPKPDDEYCNGNNIKDITDKDNAAGLRKLQQICIETNDIRTPLDEVMRVLSVLMGIQSGTAAHGGITTSIKGAQAFYSNAGKFIKMIEELAWTMRFAYIDTMEENAASSGGFKLRPFKCVAGPMESYPTSMAKLTAGQEPSYIYSGNKAKAVTGPNGGQVCPDVAGLYARLQAQFSQIRQEVHNIEKVYRKAKDTTISLPWGENAYAHLWTSYPETYGFIEPMFKRAEELKQSAQFVWALATALNFANDNCVCGMSYCKLPFCISGLPLTLAPLKDPYCALVWILRSPMNNMAKRLQEDLNKQLDKLSIE